MPPPGVRSYRAGTRAPTSLLWSVFLLLVAAAFVAAAVREHRAVLVVPAAFAGVVGAWVLLDSVNGLRPVRLLVDPDLTLSLPTFSPRHGYRRRELRWPDITDVRLTPTTVMRFPYRRLVVVGRHDTVDVDSLTCSIRARHPERTPAGRAVAELREQLGCGGPE